MHPAGRDGPASHLGVCIPGDPTLMAHNNHNISDYLAVKVSVTKAKVQACFLCHDSFRW